MKLKKTVLVALIVAGICVGAIFIVGAFAKPAPDSTQPETSVPEATALVSTKIPTPITTESVSQPSASTPQTTPQATPVPTSPACGKANGPCTAAQITAHNSTADCWVIYSGFYYIITSFVSQHPGGASVFNSTTCGHDISAYLAGTKSSAGERNSHSQTAYDTLILYRVGPVEG